MNKDIRKYIANCTLCHREKAKVQAYPLQMTEIPDRPFNNITIDLVTECDPPIPAINIFVLSLITSQVGQKLFPIPDKSAGHYSIHFHQPVHVCPRYILSDNSTEFKNHLLDQVLQNLESIQYFLHHTILRTIENWMFSIKT